METQPRYIYRAILCSVCHVAPATWTLEQEDRVIVGVVCDTCAGTILHSDIAPEVLDVVVSVERGDDANPLAVPAD